MLELTPLSRGAARSGLFGDSLFYNRKEQPVEVLRGKNSMSERILSESVSPEGGGRADHTVMVNKDRPTSRNSSDDPAISTTHSSRHVSSNSRIHPRASSINHIHSGSSSSRDQKIRSHDRASVKSKSHDKNTKSHDHLRKVSSNSVKRKRSRDSEEDGCLWTEHVSSSGRVYYYNKREDKSQWEKPKGTIKRPKEDLSSPSSKSSRTSSNLTTPSLKSASTFSRHSSTPSHSHSHTHPRTHKDVSNHKDSLSHYKTRLDHNTSHRGERRDKESSSHPSSRRGSQSRSHSRSLSPPSATSRMAGTTVRHRRTGSEKQIYVPDKTPSRHHSKSSHSVASGMTVTSPLTPKTTNTVSVVVSPTTPVNIPSTFSQAISTTQQIIDQTSILIEKQQFLISGNGDSHTPAHIQQFQGEAISVDHTPTYQQSYARHRLDFTPVNGPSTPEVPVHGNNLMDTSGLHPLQRALLLQNQYTQQQQQGYDPGLSMTPQPAIPAHLSQQGSHPGSPLIQSPMMQHGTGTPPIVHTPPGVQPLTPMQTGVFTMPLTVQGTYSPIMPGQGAYMSSVKASYLQTPMSRLGYTSMDNCVYSSFPDATLLKSLPQGPSSVDSDLVDRSLAECWTRHNEHLQSQIDSSVHNTLQVGLTDPIHLSGKIVSNRLRLESGRLAVATVNNRLSTLNSLMEEINNR